MMPLPKEEAEAHMKAMYANGGMHGGDMQGGARTTVAALTGVATNPSATLQEFKGFFEDLAGIWNGGDVAGGLRNNGKRAFATLIKYLPLAGAPGYAAATALEKLKIDSIINLLATLIDLITGRATLPQLFEALKEFIGNIFDLVKDFATNVLPVIGNAIVSGLTSVGDTIVEGLDPRLKAEGEARRKNDRLAGSERQYADLIISRLKEAAERTFKAPKVLTEDQAEQNRLAGKSETSIVNVDKYNFEATEAMNAALYPPGVVNPFAGRPDQETSTEARNQANRIAAAKKRFPEVPYWLWLRGHMPPEWNDFAKYIPSWTKDEFYAKATEGGGYGASSEYQTFVDTFEDKLKTYTSEKFEALQIKSGNLDYIQIARGKLIKKLSAELGYNLPEYGRDLVESDFAYTGEDLTYVYSAAYSKYPQKDSSDKAPPTPGKSRDVANPPVFPNYRILQGVTPDGQQILKESAMDSHTKIDSLFKVLVWNNAMEKLQDGPNEFLATTKRKPILLQKINSLPGGTAYLAANNYETTQPEQSAGGPAVNTGTKNVYVDDRPAMKQREAEYNAAQEATLAKTLRERPEIQTELSNAEREVSAIQRFTGSTFSDYTPQHELGLIPYNPDNISWKKYPFTDIKPGVRDSTEPRRSQETNKLKYPATNATASGSGMSGGSMLIEHAVRYHPHKRMRENHDSRFFM